MRLEPLIRYLKMHRMLGRPTGATIEELQEETGASRPSVYRLLDAVREMGEALVKEKLPSRHVRYSLYDPFQRGSREHSFRIARDELIAIQFVRRYARLFKGTELEQDIDNVFRKIEGTIDPKHYGMIRRAERLFLPTLKGVKDYTTGEVAETIDTLANAILLEQKCDVIYHSFSSDQTRELRIHPLHFFEHAGGLYLFAREEGKTDVRMYAVERFLKVETTGERYEYPKGFDPVRRLEKTFTIFDEEKPTTFRIRFSASHAKYIGERRWASKQKIEEQPDGSIILEMTTMGHWDVIRWVLGYGAEAELLEPQAIREEIARTLEATLGRYGDDDRRSKHPGKAEAGEIDLAHPVDLIVLSLGKTSIRCRLPGTGRELTLRTAVRREVSGEIVTVLPTKWWTRAGHPYLSGKVLGCRLDIRALGLVPLGLTPVGDWDPEEEYWGEEGEPLPDWAKPIVARGKRPAFEMEQVIPGENPDDWYSDPIIEASELNAAGDRRSAEDILKKMLASDLRCLDAHAHLGNFVIDRNPKEAARHYRVGVGIGELTLGDGFDGVLPWGLVDNRPFLRCLHGLALCLWRMGDSKEAAQTFERMLWLNPSDNQGARFNLAAVQDGLPWKEAYD